MAAITLNIGGDTRQLDRDIQKTVNKVYNINLKTKGDQPLGRITGQVNEFNKSLDASNARVIAFGASAGIIFGVERAFTALVSSTIEVQKSLQDINVILNASQANLQKFGGELFNIARNTGQSFQEVAKAATEFSRQGLGIEETLKRTSEALILSRLSGLDAAKSVESLTAAVNSFASQAVTATEVVNKFATVDAAFAVSSADLADAIARVGSSAAQSGVSLNELIAIVTSAQQTTARGGAVIGNSFKTIFTRLQREKVVDLLESLGISGTDASGQVKSTIQLLQDLGAVYDTLGSQQQAYVAEQVGGVFQINILKAALADLGKEYSIYNSALNVAAGATDQAIRRNEELNKTYAAQINALAENARQLAAAGGERLLGPSIDRLVGGTNTLLQGFSESDGQGVGAVLGKGILDGIGQFIAGPGLALIGGVLLKLFRDLAKFATGSVQQLLGLNTAATQQKDLQQSINQILAKNPQLLELALKGEQGLNTAANSLLASLQKQTVELQKQAAVAAQISKAFVAQAGVRVSGGVPVVPTPAPGRTARPGKAAGYIPNFADAELLAAKEERYTAQRSFEVNNPVLGQITVNNREKTNAVPVGGYPPGTFVVNPKQLGQVTGIPLEPIERMKNKASGFIPNFVKQKSENFTNFGGKYAYLVPLGVSDGTLPTEKIGKYKVGGIPIKSPKQVNIDQEADADSLNLYKKIKDVVVNEAFKYTNTIQPLNQGVSIDSIRSKFETTAGAAGALKGAAGAAFEVGIISALGYQSASRRGDKAGNFDIRGGANLKNIQELFDLSPTVGLADFKINADPANVKKFYDKVRKEEKAGVFDDREQTRNINRDAEVEVSRELTKDENLKKWVIGGNKISAKAPDFVKKMVEERKNLIRPRYNQSSFPKGPIMASGYIPNFAALQDAISREKSAGIPSSKIYVAQDSRLAAAGYNPFGLGVFNTRDEPTAGARSAAIKSRGYSSGYIPNFAETPESGAASIGTAATAIAAQLSTLAFTFAFSKNEVQQAMTELAKSTKAAASVQRNQVAKEIKEKRKQVQAQSLGGKVLTAAEQKEITKQNASTLRQDPTLAPKRQAAAQAVKPGFGAKAKAFGGANALGLAVAAPILAQTITQAIPQDTKGGRVGATAVGALGNIGAATATGAMFGPIGAAVGLAAGALLEIPNVVGALSTNFPELQAAVQKSSESLTKFSDAGSQLLTSYENLQSALKDPNTSQDMINKASDAYAKALMGLSSEDQKRLKQAAEIGNLEEEYAKILSEKTGELKSRESAAEAGRIAGEAEKTNNLIDMGLGVAATIPGFAPTALALKESGLVEALRPKALEIGSKEDKSNQQAFVDQILQGKTGKDAVGALEKAGGTNFVKELFQIQPGDTKALEDLLNKTIPEGAGKADFVAAQIQMANNGTVDFGNVIGSLATAFTQTTVKAQESVKTSNALTAAQQKEAKAKQEATKATQQIIDSLQRNIRMAQMAADTNRALAKANSEFQRNTAFADTFSRPTETVGKIVGQDAPLAEAFALREDIARIGFNQISNIEDVKFTFVNEINDSITSAFDEAVGETTKKASGEGKAADIEKGNKEILAPLAGQQEKAFAVVQDVLNKSLAGGGDIQTEALLSDINKSLQDANINSDTIVKITDKVREAGARGNLEIERLRDQSIKEFKTLAKEQTQRVLIAKIGQAQNFGGASIGGGIEEFINPKKPGEGVFDKVVESTKGFEQFQGQKADFRFDYMPGTNQFKYQYPEAEKARQEMAPERGQKALALIGQLQDFTGYTPDAEGKGIQAGVAGLTEFFNKQIKELENIAKTTSDPLVREEINAALKEVDKLGGTENIARLQVAQRTGALTEKGYKEITGKFQNPVLQSLQEQIKLVGAETPQGQLLAQQVEELQNVTITSQDPTIQAINSGNIILNQILDAIKNESTQAAGTTGIVESGGITPIDVTPTTKQEVNKKIKSVQQQSLPQDNRTIAEIEAETRAKRDQKLGAQPETGIYSGGYINRVRADEAILDPASQQAQTEFEQFRSREAERKAAADAELQRVLNSDTSGQKAQADFEAFRESQRIVDPRNEYALEEDKVRRQMIERDQMFKSASPISPALQNQPAATTQQPFAQQEAAFSNNTSAITTLAGGIENLNSTLSNFQANFANLNNIPTQQTAGGTQQAGTQPSISTTTSAPVTVVVNAEGGGDIATAVGAAIQNAIPNIINQVRRQVLNEKVPPTVSRPPLTTNPKFGAGKRADGGFLL
jgi:TP901 family phage tail tape measure protein